MKIAHTLAQFFSGALGGTVFLLIGLSLGMNYGGNYGCPAWIGPNGYESCGSFGAVAGLLLGSVLGVMLAARLVSASAGARWAWVCGILAALIPIGISALLLFAPQSSPRPFNNAITVLYVLTSLVLPLACLIPSGIVIFALHLFGQIRKTP